MKSTNRSGFTALEATIAITLLSLMTGMVIVATTTGSQAVQTSTESDALDSQVQRALDSICEILESTSSASVAPDPESPFSTNRVDFQRRTGEVDGVVQWGSTERLAFMTSDGEVDDDLDNDGNGLADEGQVLLITEPDSANETRAVLCSYVSEYLEGEEFNGLDDNGNGLIDEPGFCMDFADHYVTLRLTLRRRTGRGLAITSTQQRTIAFRFRD